MDMFEFGKKLLLDNVEIAKALGWSLVDTDNGGYLSKVNGDVKNRRTIKGLDYHETWDSLMEVIDIIESMEIDGDYIDFHIMTDAIMVTLQKKEDNPIVLINLSECKGSLEEEFTHFVDKKSALYSAVVIVCKWLNTKN